MNHLDWFWINSSSSSQGAGTQIIILAYSFQTSYSEMDYISIKLRVWTEKPESTWVIKVQLSLNRKLPLINTQFLIEAILAYDLNMLADILVDAVPFETFDYFLADGCLQQGNNGAF